jgi:hypothetical protein
MFLRAEVSEAIKRGKAWKRHAALAPRLKSTVEPRAQPEKKVEPDDEYANWRFLPNCLCGYNHRKDERCPVW